PTRDLAGGHTRGPLHHLCPVLGQLGAAECSTGRPNLSLYGQLGPPQCGPLAAQHASPPQWGTGPGAVSGSLARGRAAPVGQAEARSGPAVRVRPRESTAPPRSGPAGGEHPGLYRGHATCLVHRLLGSRAPADARSAAPPPGSGAWARLAGAAPATRKKPSPTAPLPTRACRHRRQKRARPLLYDQPLAA